jgi:hypothetical protein
MGTNVRWQYLVVPAPLRRFRLVNAVREDDLQKELDKHGALGWELVQILAPATPVLMSGVSLVFKRPS